MWKKFWKDRAKGKQTHKEDAKEAEKAYERVSKMLGEAVRRRDVEIPPSKQNILEPAVR